MTLRLDWATYEAAKFACEKWHYSGCMPAARTVKIGVWESGAFKGVVIFSRGSTPKIGSPYRLAQTECCELTRVALRQHDAPVSRILSIALRLLHRHSPGLRLVISYAAGEEGHHGGIYQAGGWVYEGAMDSYVLVINGERVHARTVSMRYGSGALAHLQAHVDSKAAKVKGLVRHKYLMPLDAAMRQQIAPLAKPYPKRDTKHPVESAGEFTAGGERNT